MTEPKRDDAPLWQPPPEFLRELPDMISGTDPELLKPEARAWLLRDPQAREYAQQICGAIAMFADVPSRMAATSAEPLSTRAKRAIEVAAKQLPRRLAEVLWPLLMIEIDRVASTNGSSFIDPTAKPGSLQTMEPTLIQERDRLVEMLRRANRATLPSRRPPYAMSSAPSGLDAIARATHLIDSHRAILGTGPLNQWTVLLLDSVSQRRILRFSDWSTFVTRHARITTNYHAHVLQTAALAFESEGRVREAVAACETVVRDHPSSPATVGAAYTGLKLASKVGRVELLRRFFSTLERALTNDPAQVSVWQHRLLLDAPDWSQVHTVVPDIFGDLLTLLGRSSHPR